MKNEKGKQKIASILLILALIPLITGCTSLFGTQKKDETKIQETQGVGVLEFAPVTTKMLASTNTPTYNYILLSVRNNAEGNKAKNIKVSLENVDPFLIYEGGTANSPSTPRLVSSQFFNDYDLPYRTHKIDTMQPDEEMQFFWNIQAPSEEKIAGMTYTHNIYYTLDYEYTSTMTQTIACISQDEYLKQSKEGPVSLSGQTLSSPGEIRLTSKTQQPLLYSEGFTEGLDFTMQFDVTNNGEGVPRPGSNITIAIKPDELVDITTSQATIMGWSSYANAGSLKTDFDKAFPATDFEELDDTLRSKLWLFRITSEQLSAGKYTLLLPAHFNTGDIYEPQKILTFNAYIAYTYLKEGSTSISVYPVEQQ